MSVTYEALAAEPERAFPPLCAWLGGSWEPRALAYWESPCHGLGANGASSLYLRTRPHKHYRTGDDAYYDALFETRRTVVDERWRERLPPEFCRRAVASPEVAEIAAHVAAPGWAAP